MDGQVITDQRGKEEAFHMAYKELLGRDTARGHTLDVDYSDITPIDLSEQDLIFQEEEIWNVIKEMPSDRASGPDGFIGIFFQKSVEHCQRRCDRSYAQAVLGERSWFWEIESSTHHSYPKDTGGLPSE